MDKQRNVAVALGERDVKADVNAKNRSAGRGTSRLTVMPRSGHLVEGDVKADVNVNNRSAGRWGRQG